MLSGAGEMHMTTSQDLRKRLIELNIVRDNAIKNSTFAI